jgi:hypothetical protein
MIKEGVVTPEEGLALLEAVGEDTDGERLTPSKSGKKWLVIKVFDPSEKAKVNLKVPLSLATFGLKMAKKKSADLEGIDVDEIIQMIDGGNEDSLVDIDTENGESVKIFIE